MISHSTFKRRRSKYRLLRKLPGRRRRSPVTYRISRLPVRHYSDVSFIDLRLTSNFPTGCELAQATIELRASLAVPVYRQFVAFSLFVSDRGLLAILPFVALRQSRIESEHWSVGANTEWSLTKWAALTGFERLQSNNS